MSKDDALKVLITFARNAAAAWLETEPAKQQVEALCRILESEDG